MWFCLLCLPIVLQSLQTFLLLVVVVVVEELITELSGNCMKYLDTLNKVQIDQKSDVVLLTVSAHCLTITLNSSFC